MEIYPCGLWQVICTEAEADIVLFNHDSVWEDFQSKPFPILTCNLEIAEPILLNVNFKSSTSYTIQEAICRLIKVQELCLHGGVNLHQKKLTRKKMGAVFLV
ncbi:hypothetical protein L1987_71990 [Smallanthus sonchifolius]|uniref:Uncharacterized protein n=1 Tax=Smallanthus sonchifolius TaxID=185202 RepID=A0ACB9AUC6_9ASTR|nr:hypothetical protein L1987_71990 [Smallanthus sonchifolius]